MKTFTIRVNEVLPPEPLLDVDDEFYDPVLHAPQATVHFSMLRGFEEPPCVIPQMRVGLSDLEGRPIFVEYCSQRRTGSYSVLGHSKFIAGSIVVGEIRTQLRTATTRSEILDQLLEDPAGKMITLYPNSAWIVPDPRAHGEEITTESNDESSELIKPEGLVVELLLGGQLELDGAGVVKLKGYAFVPATGSDYCAALIEDLQLGKHFLRIPWPWLRKFLFHTNKILDCWKCRLTLALWRCRWR